MNTTEQASLRKASEGTWLKILKSSVKSDEQDAQSTLVNHEMTHTPFWPLQNSAQRGMATVTQFYTILS